MKYFSFSRFLMTLRSLPVRLAGLVLILWGPLLVAQEGVTYCPAPPWVKEYAYDECAEAVHAGLSFNILIDNQVHVEKEASYHRELTKFTTCCRPFFELQDFF